MNGKTLGSTRWKACRWVKNENIKKEKYRKWQLCQNFYELNDNWSKTNVIYYLLIILLMISKLNLTNCYYLVLQKLLVI
jgi:hypothetical protein